MNSDQQGPSIPAHGNPILCTNEHTNTANFHIYKLGSVVFFELCDACFT